MKTVEDLMKISYDCWGTTETCDGAWLCCLMHAIADDMILRGEY